MRHDLSNQTTWVTHLIRQCRLGLFYQTEKAPLPIRKRRLGLSNQTTKVTHPIRQCRLGLFYQTAKATLLIRKRRLGSFDQTVNAIIPIRKQHLGSLNQTDKASLVQSDSECDFSSQKVQTWLLWIDRGLTLSVEHERHDPSNQTPKAWLCKLPLPDLKEKTTNFKGRRLYR